ncbi:Splicing factor 3B subunit 2 [Trichinella zimbabwensis]|uniref:Splicing factor 3B subunit 2 n=1 Tax=Trichinella zimbabwensis TaxID=268475 RepID=A0A0V1H7E3_9BILA|nr:Splicing factor 3B subunit 2 [Trichinella zimbabwensis]
MVLDNYTFECHSDSLETYDVPEIVTEPVVNSLASDGNGNDTTNKPRKNRTQKRKEQKKRAKQRRRNALQNRNAANENEHDSDSGVEEALEDVEIEYVTEELDPKDPMYLYYLKVFEAYRLTAPEDRIKEEKDREEFEQWTRERLAPKAAIVERIVQDVEEAKQEKLREEAGKLKLSKKKLRLLNRPSIGQLKSSTSRPDVVEWHDVTAKDPKLLVHLKSIRNTVPVPRHWCFKRKYLAGKRGFEKPAFDLPDFIKKTGIMEMRQALQEKEDQKSMKSKMREKIRPKMGKIDIDYQKLHDAFFRWQIRPKMSMIGDMYYEGKEFETKLREKKPGDLTDDLRVALGMPIGPNAHRYPPPWLIAMQRYGPPPSYPNLKIPGLNAPIPEGCAFGYHAGGWGKPPVDEAGRPLYGDVFGIDLPSHSGLNEDDDIERKHWGEWESDEYSTEEETESEDEEKEEEEDAEFVPSAEGLVTPSGISTGISTTGAETPDAIELRKKKVQDDTSKETPSLYTLLPEKKVDSIVGQMMASTHVYDLSAAATAKKDQRPDNAVEISLNPEELDLADTSGLQQRYEEGLKKMGKEDDFSDMVAEHAAKQKRKRKTTEDKKSSTKKYKDFKF